MDRRRKNGTCKICNLIKKVPIPCRGQSGARSSLRKAQDRILPPSVLVARVKAHLAQVSRLRAGGGAGTLLKTGEISVDTAAHRVYKNGREVELKNKEYELLVFFMTNRGLLFSREELYEKIWGMETLGDNATVAVHINRLREKLEDDPARPAHITTVRGAGYRFE